MIRASDCTDDSEEEVLSVSKRDLSLLPSGKGVDLRRSIFYSNNFIANSSMPVEMAIYVLERKYKSLDYFIKLTRRPDLQ